jgi:AcrR family transcriptional regulator
VADGSTAKRLTRAESQARTRRQILDAAARIFAKKGFADATVEEIAESAGYSVGALYSNFAGKDQLLVELMVDQRARRISAITEVLSGPDGDFADHLVRLSHVLGEFADHGGAFAGPGQAGVQRLRSAAVRREVNQQLRGQTAELEELLAGVMAREGVAPGVSPQIVTTVVLALVQGLVRRRRFDRAGVDDDVIGQALRWLFAGIAATSPTGGHPTESR